MGSKYEIVLQNLSDGDTFHHSLILGKGYIKYIYMGESESIVQSCVNVDCLNNPKCERTAWPVVNSEFKCLVYLHPGSNDVMFSFSNVKYQFKLTFEPLDTLFCLVPLYIICKDNDGCFQSPVDEDNSVKSACERIGTVSKLIQTVLSEIMMEHGIARCIFQLESDLIDSKPPCHAFQTSLTVDSVYNMSANELWEFFAREIMTSPLANNCSKYLAILSCTRYVNNVEEEMPVLYEDILNLTKGHVSLGGGGLALFGSGCLHTWPCSVKEVLCRFHNQTKVDRSKFMDDSYFKGTYGGCFATTLGAVCHELCHTFDLGHANQGLMSHEFGLVDAIFKPGVEPLGSSTPDSNIVFNKGQKNKVQQMFVKPGNVRPFLLPSSAFLLKYHRWFSEQPGQAESKLVFEEQRGILSSPHGIRVIEVRRANGIVIDSWTFPDKNGRSMMVLPLWKIRRNCPGEERLMLVAEDSVGHILKCSIPKE